MKLHELKAVEGSTKARKRIGHGPGSGTGKTSGKGEKGQNARRWRYPCGCRRAAPWRAAARA